LNENSIAVVDINDSTNMVKRVFICPGIMDTALKHVRPIISLDAAHLKSEWKGTLYVASVKSACDEIYPIAVTITEQYENFDGWRWFLEHLQEGVPTLVLPHPRKEVTKKYFTFMSDRQKGLVEALKDIFPENHSCSCAVHIARNVHQVKFGKKMSKYILPLSMTFSPYFLEEILSKMTEDSRQYVEGIPASAWRNTEWVRDPSLPPRYGIWTSNMSEVTNSMFEEAREGSWLQSLHTMITKMME
jgi:MULE transposase domain